jgi:hypothetical protein
MKKSTRLLLSVLCLLAFSFNSRAQVSVGLRGGVNFANFIVKDDSQDYPFKAKTGLNFAVLFNLPLSASTSIQFEPGFSQRGAKISEKLDELVNGQQIKVEVKGKMLVNYIEMPVLFQYKPQFGKLQGIFSLGPDVRLMTGNLKTESSSKAYINGELIDESNGNESYSSDDARKFDYGLVGGVGLSYPLGAIKVFAEGRYHFGLRNLATSVDGDDSKVYNRGAAIHIGILVPVGK